MKTLFIFICFLFSLVINASKVNAQNATPVTITIPIGDILASMSNTDPAQRGVVLTGGNRAYCEKIVTGTGDASDPGFGQTGGFSMGGSFSGKVLPSFTGNSDKASFTRIYSADARQIGSGQATNCQNSIGFHIWFKNPVASAQFLFVDIDGTQQPTGAGTAEWVSAFGYLNGTRVLSSIDYQKNPNDATKGYGIEKSSNPLVNASWNTMLAGLQGFAVGTTREQFRTDGTTSQVNPSVMYRNTPAGNTDPVAGDASPDALECQANFTYSPSSFINHFICLWGKYGSAGTTLTQQNSGMSGISITVNPDFGDAPASYLTNFADGGPYNGLWSDLKLGASFTNELNTKGATSNANSDDGDDGIASITSFTAKSRTSYPVSTYTASVKVTNTIGNPATLVGWLDWNNNGTFESDEAVVVSNIASQAGEQTIPLTWTNKTLTVNNKDRTFLRIRLSTDPLLDASKIGGYLTDGEVEDYMVPIILSLLPVKMTDFTATVKDCQANLNWVTVSEQDVSRFEIEQSTNGTSWTVNSSVAAFGNSSIERSYSKTVTLQPNVNNYFRIKTIDIDGQYSYSGINKASCGSTPIITMSPNPVQDILHINNLPKGAKQVIIYNSVGQEMLRRMIVFNPTTVSMATFTKGIYTVKILSTAGEVLSVQKVIR